MQSGGSSPRGVELIGYGVNDSPPANGSVWLGAILVAFGPGVPTFAAPSGSVFLRTDGGAGSSLYVMEGTSWAAK